MDDLHTIHTSRMSCKQWSRAGLYSCIVLMAWHSCTAPATAQAQPRGLAEAPAAQLSTFVPSDCRSVKALTAPAEVCSYAREHCSGGGVPVSALILFWSIEAPPSVISLNMNIAALPVQALPSPMCSCTTAMCARLASESPCCSR